MRINFFPRQRAAKRSPHSYTVKGWGAGGETKPEVSDRGVVAAENKMRRGRKVGAVAGQRRRGEEQGAGAFLFFFLFSRCKNQQIFSGFVFGAVFFVCFVVVVLIHCYFDMRIRVENQTETL